MINKRLALTFIFITVLLDSVGFGIILPVMPQLIMTITGEPLSKPRQEVVKMIGIGG